MCYPPTPDAAKQILAVQKRLGLRHVFLATDSPHTDALENLMLAQGVTYVRYGQHGPSPALGSEFALPVDQVLPSMAIDTSRLGHFTPCKLRRWRCVQRGSGGRRGAGDGVRPRGQALCAMAPHFLGNIPSTVTATIVQERDAAGFGRETTEFFGFTRREYDDFRDRWLTSSEFAASRALSCE
jgi:hypothetical protein